MAPDSDDRDPFGPLGDAEPETAEAMPRKWVPVLPVPDDAPPAPHHAREVARWAYRDAEGCLVGHVVRIEPGHADRPKDIRPLVYAEQPGGERAWRWMTWARPHPLYGLDRLAERPEAPVVVAEGERTADAVERLWPDVVAVTSPGGAQAAAYADWAPLAGRHVVVWPDADAPGADYGAGVARLARAAGAASLRLVAVPAEWPDGWDLADPAPEGWDMARLRALLDSAPEAEAEAEAEHDECGGVRWPFRVGADGVYACEEDRDGEREWRRICSPLVVVAGTRSDAGEEWGRLLRVTDPDGADHEWAMPMALLAGGGDEYRARLLALGLRLAPGARAKQRLHEYLSETLPTDRVRCVSRLGWHGSVYVLPDATYGATGGEAVRMQTDAPLDHAYREAGTLAEWQREVAAPCAGQSRLLLAVSAAFAAPLLALVGAESGGIHLHGPSSVGKTTALRVAGSVWGGRPDPRGYTTQWRATANGLETVALAHCDALLCLDEMGQADPREAGEAAYMLANGAGKQRARRDGSGRPAASWRVLYLSTGEVTLADRVREDRGRRATAGQAVRVVDVPADAGAGLGIFDTVGVGESAGDLARRLASAASRYYGTAARAYLARLAAEPDDIARQVRAYRDEWASGHCPAEADGQVRRVAERMALVAAAGELAAVLGIVPWAEGEAAQGVATCWRAWLAARGSTGPAELATALDRVRAWLVAHGAGRFAALHPVRERDGSPREERIHDRAGWWREVADEREYLVPVAVWRAELAVGIDTTVLARALAERGWLRPGADRSAQSVSVPGHGRQRVYVLSAAALGGDDAY